MRNKMTQNEQEGSVKLSVADVKDRKKLVSEVTGFANALLQTAAEHDNSNGDVVLTFHPESVVNFALTLHQLLAVVHTMEKN